MVVMHKAPPAVGADLRPDPAQSAVLADAAHVRLVLGAPGTGKTSLAVECIADAVANGASPDQCVLLAPTRSLAADLRDRVTERLQVTSTEPIARSHQAFAFGLLRQVTALQGEPTPRLLNGPEQDVILRDLLEGHSLGEVPGPDWPPHLDQALTTRGFRAELRDLLMRAVEWGLTGADLAELGRRADRPEWVAAAQFLIEYDSVTALSQPGAYDAAWINGAAADQLEDDPAALARVRDSIRHIVIDDAQELTHASARLLTLLAVRGTRVTLIGDPDVTTQGFRGAEPGLFLRLGEQWGATTAHVLDQQHRLGPQLCRVAADVASRIGVLGDGSRRRPQPTTEDGVVEVALVRAVAQESAHVAAVLRRAHLIDGLAWSDMAVIVRGQARAATLRRALISAGVPVAVSATAVPLRDEPAVRPLLDLFELAAQLGQGEAAPNATEIALDALTSVIGGADAVRVRRIRRTLRHHELAAGGERSSDELLAAALLNAPADKGAWLTALDPVLFPLQRIAQIVFAASEALSSPSASAEDVLWQMWVAAGVADDWRRAALAGGSQGERADRDLDAVVALFASAATYVDRVPGAAPVGFLEHIRGQEVAGDRLVAGAPVDEHVALLTPQAAVGRQWAFVVVAGVQEGVWPDLRLRGSLLGSEALVDVLSGRGDSLQAQQAAVRYDETRQFLVAVTRASRRLLVTAVRSEDEQPSPYLDLVDPLGGAEGGDPDLLREFTRVEPPMTLRAMVAGLRREVTVPARRAPAAELLADLAAAGVPGAAPASWWAFHALSDVRPRRDPQQRVQVSPSAIERFGECGLRWLLVDAGGDGPDQGSATLGTLVHEIAAEFVDDAPERMHDALDERWGRLGMGSGWLGARTKVQAHRMIDLLITYVDQARSAGWSPVGHELPFAVDVGRARVGGTVDRLEAHADRGLRIIDYKTGSTPPTKDEIEHHPQLGAYQVAVVAGAFEASAAAAGVPGELRHTSGGAALVQVGKAALTTGPRVQAQEPVAADDPWASELIDASADGMGAATYQAVVNRRCGTCAVRYACPLQTSVGIE